MHLLLTVKQALKNIRSNKLRSSLTILGLVIGIASVIALVGIANGSSRSVTEQVSSLGTDILTVSITGSDTSISYDDLSDFSTLGNVAGIAPYKSVSATVSRGTVTSSRAALIATNASYLTIMRYDLEKGRTISEIDIENSSKVVILGSAIAEDLFDAVAPVGETIKIEGDNYTVIGVLESQGSSMGNTVDDMLMIPITTVKFLGEDTAINSLYIRVDDENQVDMTTMQIENYLRGTLQISSDDYSVTSQDSTLEAMEDITNTLSLLLGAIASISLLVGGIGVMNVMLVSVSERTREIGIRKALGAKRKDISKQFLMEALVLSIFGGIIGIAFGFLCGGIAMLFGAAFVPGAGIVLLSFFVSAAVGLVFGIFPSYRAACLNPIDALKQE